VELAVLKKARRFAQGALMRVRFPALIISLACGLTAACDGVRDSDYEGEVLAALQGTILAPEEDVYLPEGIGVAVLWEVMNYVPGLQFMDFAEVTGEFPSRFRLDLHQPPDEGLLVEMPDGNAITLGRLYLTSPETEDPILHEHGFSYTYSACTPATAIAFIRDDVAPGSAAAAYFGCGLGTPDSPPCSALTAGYHVMDLFLDDHVGEGCDVYAAPDEEAYCEPNDVRLTEQDLETEIEIVVPENCHPVDYREPATGW
jgi:hypothetical protein